MSGMTLAELLWSAPRLSRRGPRPRVDLAGIVAAAVQIADADGLAATSMQRVADELAVTKMALYRYVPGWDELVALMIEAALAPPPELTGDWRDRLRGWSDAMHALARDHRWLAGAAVGGRLIGPVEAGWMETGLAALDGLPMSSAERLDTLALLAGHVRGVVAQEVTAHPEATTGTLLLAALHRRPDDYPLTAGAFASAMAGGGTDDAYRFGLDRIVAGIEALVRVRPARAQGETVRGPDLDPLWTDCG